MAFTGRNPGDSLRPAHASGAARTGKEIQQAQPDVIDYSEYQKNSSIAGLIAAFQGFFVKGGMGLTSFIIGAFLKKGGYVANTVQSEQALSCIELYFIWIPVILCLIIAVLTYFYKLDPICEEMTEELEQRRSCFACEE